MSDKCPFNPVTYSTYTPSWTTNSFEECDNCKMSGGHTEDCYDFQVQGYRNEIVALNAKLAEMARLAEDSAKAAEELTACDEPCAWRHIINTNPFSKEPEEYFYPSCCHGAYQIDHGFIYCPQCGRKIKESDDDDA